MDFELQKAIYSALNAAHGAGKVYDHVPQQKPALYVVIGEGTTTDFDTDDSIGDEDTVTIHTWSTYRGMKELKQAMALNKTTLHDQPLTIVGRTYILGLLEFSESMVDPDGVTRHGVQRFRFITEVP